MHNQIPSPSVALSMMVSETAYRAVVGVTRIVRRIKR